MSTQDGKSVFHPPTELLNPDQLKNQPPEHGKYIVELTAHELMHFGWLIMLLDNKTKDMSPELLYAYKVNVEIYHNLYARMTLTNGEVVGSSKKIARLEKQLLKKDGVIEELLQKLESAT